jgi:acetyl-CoA carboxylase biotin carboxylase subunit
VSAAAITGAEAIHPGYGFLAENSSFAEVCAQVKIKFIGPPPSVIDAMGNKASARDMMRAANVPIIPGTSAIRDEREAQDAAKEIGYPLIIKASAGGGGKGMRVVQNEDELLSALSTARAEAEAAFGDAEVYIEKYLTEPRHVEVQILADEHGEVIHLGERDCSVQTARHQKMLEESPCIFIPEKTRKRWAKPLCAAPKPWLPERGHHRVSRRFDRRVLLHGDEHAHSGRASRHGVGERRRSHQGTVAHCIGERWA